MPTLSSSHTPSAMNTISIRGWGKKWKDLSMNDVTNYAQKHKCSFVCAYKTLTNRAFEGKEIEDNA